MKAVIRNLIFVLFVLFLSQPALAVGTYSYDCNSICIWDISGTYDEDFGAGLGIDMSTSYDITQDEQGKFTGSGYADGSVMGYDIYMSYVITGSITQKNNIGTVKLSMKFNGTITDGYDTLKFRGTESLKGTIDPSSGTINGTVKVRVSIPGYGSDSSSDSFSFDISDDDMDGSFTMTMDTNSVDGKKLTGTAQIILSNGDVYNFTATGKCNPKKNIETATMKGIDSIIKSKLKATINATDGQIISVSGTVLGQKIKGVNIEP